MTTIRIGDELGGRPNTEFPPSTMPTAYAEGASSYIRGEGVVKFYLYRTDSNMFGRGGYVSNPFVQVVMPNEGFVRTVALFQRAVNSLIQSGHITQAQIDDMQRQLDEINPTHSSSNA